MTVNAAHLMREETHPIKETCHPARPHHLRLHVRARHGRCRTVRRDVAARLRPHARDRDVALRSGVAGARVDRQAGVRLEPVCVLPWPARLLVHRVEQLRHPASEPVPGGVARTSRCDVAGAGAVADPVRPHARVLGVAVRRPTVPGPVDGARVPTRARVVLT